MAQSPQTAQFVAPNTYQLSGDGISIGYSPDAGPVTQHGSGRFTYQDAYRALTFSGDQIRRVDVPDLGTVVSVTLSMTVDTGSTTFSVLLPPVNLPNQPGAPAPIYTVGITTAHNLSPVPALNQGQRDRYTVTPLGGTASNVIVPL